MDAGAVLQSMGDRLKTVHFDLERKITLAFTGGQAELATTLHEALGHVDLAIDVLTQGARAP